MSVHAAMSPQGDTSAPEHASALRAIPTPEGRLFFGNALELWRDPLQLIARACREHGDVVRLRFGPYDYYVVNSAEGAKHLLVDNHKNYVKSRNYQALRVVLGDGLITSEGDFWRRQRKLVQPAFHRERLAGFAATMADDTAAMLARWRSEGAIGGELDLQAEMLRLTFRIVGRTLFSVDVDGDAEPIGRAINVALQWAEDFSGSIVKIPTWVPTPSNVRFGRARRVLDELVMRIIRERRESRQDRPDLLSMLMAATFEGDDAGAAHAQKSETMDDRQLRDEVMTLVLAGHETTANALTWAFYLLSKHPDVERRMHREVVDVLGDRAPTFEDLPKLRYTQMVVQETMRLYPPVWIFEREAIAEDRIGPYAIPKGAVVAVSPWALHRNEAYWSNPEGFDPERFSQAEIERRPRHAYLPFSVGPRVCVGNSFAMMEAQIILAAVVQRHRLELVPSQDIELDPKITLRPKHGLRMMVRARA